MHGTIKPSAHREPSVSLGLHPAHQTRTCTDLHARVNVGTRVGVGGQGQAQPLRRAFFVPQRRPPATIHLGSPSIRICRKRYHPSGDRRQARDIYAFCLAGRRLPMRHVPPAISAATYHRWRHELGGQNNEPRTRPSEPSSSSSNTPRGRRAIGGSRHHLRPKGHQDSA